MKKIILLVAVSLIFFYGCGQKAEKAEAPMGTETVVTETPAVTETPVVTETPAQAPAEQPAVTAPAVQETAPAVAAPFVKPDVKSVQQALTNAGLYKGKIDGVLGPKTKQAIKNFQTQNSLTADGKVGPKTWEKLATYLTQQTTPTQGAGQ